MGMCKKDNIQFPNEITPKMTAKVASKKIANIMNMWPI